MDSKSSRSSRKAKRAAKRNEKKKKMKESGGAAPPAAAESQPGKETKLDEKILDEETGGSGSGNSTDSEDLVNAINYNTITSLAALKDILQGDANDTPETDSFFQHYFMNHCNSLSSRSAGAASPFPFPERRRLSQCREEDEEDEKHHAEHTVIPESGGSRRTIKDLFEERRPKVPEEANDEANVTVMGAHHKFLVTKTKPPKAPLSPVARALSAHTGSHTVHFGTKGAEEQRPSVRSIFAGQNLHRDKLYFDSSLVEIRSTVDGTATSSEDIWVKRADEKVTQVADELRKNSVDRDSKASVEEDLLDRAEPRPRAGTWGSQTAKKEIAKKIQKDATRRSSGDRRQRRDQRLDAAITRSTQSVGERRRRSSNDDGQPHQMYQQTIHGTSGVSRRPALFDIFKTRARGEPRPRQPSIMQQVKAAVQNMTKSGPAPKDDKSESKTLDTEPAAKAKDGSAHPHPGSDTRVCVFCSYFLLGLQSNIQNYV